MNSGRGTRFRRLAYGLSALAVAIWAGVSAHSTARAQAPDDSPESVPSNPSDQAAERMKIRLMNPGKFAATTRSNGTKSEIGPNKVRTIQTSKNPYNVEYWSGDPKIGYKTQTISKSGNYAFRYDKGQFYLEEKQKASKGAGGATGANPQTAAGGGTGQGGRAPGAGRTTGGAVTNGGTTTGIPQGTVRDPNTVVHHFNNPATGYPIAGFGGNNRRFGGGNGGGAGNLDPVGRRLIDDFDSARQAHVDAVGAHKDAVIDAKDGKINELQAEKAAGEAKAEHKAAHDNLLKAWKDATAALGTPAYTDALNAVKKARDARDDAKKKLDAANQALAAAKDKRLAAEQTVAARKNAADAARDKRVAMCDKLMAHLAKKGMLANRGL